MSSEENRRIRGALLLSPALIVTAIVFVLPLLLLARYSLNEFRPGEFMVPALTLQNYVNVILDPYYRNVLFTTVMMAAGITVVSLLLGFPLASAIARAGRYKKLLILMVIVPLFVGNAVRAAGWMIAFGEQGLVNSVLVSIGALDHPITIMFTPWAVLIGSIAVNIPFVALTIQSVLEGINPSIQEASASLGARPLTTLRRVTLPLAMPGIKTAGVLSFILGMNAYATPVLLGGPSFQMMAPVLTDEILGKNNWPTGAAISFILIATTLILSILIGRVGSRQRG